MGTFKIKKGNHYCLHPIKLSYGKTTLRAKFTLTDSCWFLLETPDDFAINKLVGFSIGWHHKDSIRLGWTPAREAGVIDLFMYMYSGGYRIEKYFTSVEVNKEYEINISLGDNLAYFSLRHEGLTINDSQYYKYPGNKIGYYLFPYVGGNKAARVDTYIDLELK